MINVWLRFHNILKGEDKQNSKEISETALYLFSSALKIRINYILISHKHISYLNQYVRSLRHISLLKKCCVLLKEF